MQLEPGDAELLLDGARQLASQHALPELSELVCALVRRLADADGATFVVREGSMVLHVHDDALGPQHLPIEACIAGWAMLHREVVAVANVVDDERVADRYASTFVKSLVVVPVRADDPVAAIGVYWAKPADPTARVIARVEAIAGFAALALDGALRYAAEAEARRQAELASRAKDEFLALLAHELRSSLAPAATALHLIERGSDPFAREHAIIDRQIHQVVHLVDDLLDVSRINRGAIQLRRAPIELASIVARGLQAARSLIEERGHHIVVSVSETGLVVDADIDRLAQCVASLVTNAAKYTPRGGRIEVRADIEGSCARLVVHDSGSGIEAGLLPRLFDPFLQAQRTTERAEGGLGLGLAIVRSLVELHGGVVSAASEGFGRGSTFTIRLPLFGVAEDATLDEPLRPAATS